MIDILLTNVCVCVGVFMRGLCVRHTDEYLRTNPLRRMNLCMRFVVSKITTAQNNEWRQWLRAWHMVFSVTSSSPTPQRPQHWDPASNLFTRLPACWLCVTILFLFYCSSRKANAINQWSKNMWIKLTRELYCHRCNISSDIDLASYSYWWWERRTNDWSQKVTYILAYSYFFLSHMVNFIEMNRERVLANSFVSCRPTWAQPC